MTNLRIANISVINSTTISIKFTASLAENIGINNVSIFSQTPNVPDSSILKIDISGAILTITCQPLTPLASYFVICKSVAGILFKSLNGDAILSEDGVANQELIVGPPESDNSVQDFLINYLRDSIYNVTDSTTLINKFVNGLTSIYSKALYDIRQLKNENYLSFLVTDEKHVRSAGPFDRLQEEAAYEILRVAKTQTGTNADLTISVDDFGRSEITLLSQTKSEILLPSSIDKSGYFNINDFILTVSNQNVSKLISITFTYSDSHAPYVYDIEKFGYQILDSRYDQDFGSNYLLLNNNQFKISFLILDDPNFTITNIFHIQASYEYKDLGRIVDSTSVKVFNIFKSARETIPPMVNIFSLKHAPITDQLGSNIISGGVIFIDPNGITSTSPHPAFLTEIPFSFGAPPSRPGQYSIDYSTSTVYVYGNDSTNNGTGGFPPLATYYYKFVYVSSVDYVYDADTNDLVALPNGNLINKSGNITFNYEQVLVPGIDYKANLHIETLEERIENRLLALNALSVLNAPITNVFRIFNETSGEIYNIIRWNNNKVYFTYNTPPNILSTTGERASFFTILNEILFINTILTNTNNVKIFKCLLQNNNIISITEDSISSSINSSATFSDNQIFVSELWYDINETIANNINKIAEIGEYQIDYTNGIVYVGVLDPTNINIGSISYKNNIIVPQFPHIISVDDIYYRINLINPKDKQFSYLNFSDGKIVPSTFDVSDESFLGGDLTAPYQVHNNKIGAFVNAIFEPVVSNNIKFIRSIYEFNDLQNNTRPLNFGPFATFISRTITINPIIAHEFGTVQHNVTDGYYVLINLNLPYISPNITFNITITRLSDSNNLWDAFGIIIPGNQIKLILSGINSPNIGDSVLTNYSININDLSRIVVDYNKGEYYIDYSYLADEIIISYEFGDNILDFRQSLAVPEGTTYYVSYRVGALRDALLKNFGTLINIPELSVFDTTFERERYRDVLSAALSSFIQGPTISAMGNLVEQITHIRPEILESAFNNWALGSSLLNPANIETTGTFNLVPAKYDNGVIIDTHGQTITFPVSSNLRIEEGTFESWISPLWNGIDNEANLTITIKKDGYILDSDHVFIGAGEYHPIYSNDGSFTINKNNEVVGIPNLNKDGVFIYYNQDITGIFDRWYCEIVDGYSDGYGDGYATTYNIKILSDGLFYDVKPLTIPQPSNIKLTTGTNKLLFNITNGPAPFDEAITFVSDLEHYILDFGEGNTKNRMSIFKDPSGYMNFRVYDKNNKLYIVSADISQWKANDFHHIAASWLLNTPNERDEIHLFIDGLEVPNIIRYGMKLQPYLHEKFRTINPEEIAGVITKNIVSSNDLITTIGNNVVSSSLNFNNLGINIGDTIFIDEAGFNALGYTITLVNGNFLTLSSVMPLSITDGAFSINRTSIKVITEIDIYPNIAVSTISSILDGYDGYTTTGSSIIGSSTINFTTEGILPGYLVRIDNTLFRSHYTILNVSGNSLTINDSAPDTLTNANFHIYKNDPIEIPGERALFPAYSISADGYFTQDGYNIITLSNDVHENDLVIINTLGINHKRTRQKYYEWGDGYNNIITTRLPPPISLSQVSISHILLAPTIIIPPFSDGYNSTLVGNVFTSYQLFTDQPSFSDNGRTLQVSITTNNNLDFSTPATVNINGIVGVSTITETLTFTQVGSQNTLNKFSSINYIQVSGTTFNTSKNILVISVQEAYPITTSENSILYPAIRFSYQVLASSGTLSGSGDTVTDNSNLFSSLDTNNYLIISSPGPVAGTYKILSVSEDHHSIIIDASLSNFSSGTYQILNTTTFRSGFQNGFFVLEDANSPGTPYVLRKGLYQLDYYTYLSIKTDPLDVKAYLGTDMSGNNILNAILDEVKIISSKLTDTRIGEIVAVNVETVTKDFNSLKELTSDSNTLMLAHFNNLPFINDAEFFIRSKDKTFIESGNSINDNFGQSIVITDKPIIIENDGIINKKEGTIEFWVNPSFDTQNDPNNRFYFDASSVQIENVISIDEVSISVSGRVGQVISVKLQNGDQSIDYFAGGKVETSTQGAIVEEAVSTGSNTAIVSKQILQVITVKIANDPTNTDYFAGGIIGTDGKTIFLSKTLPESYLNLVITYKPASGGDQTINSQIIRLNRQLPNQQTPVTVTYIPNGSQGDRISIFKDTTGYINFVISASNIDYAVRAPAVWASNSWHRIKAMYSINGGQNNDMIRLFIDGYERGNVLFGTGLLFGDPHVFGSSFVGSSTIKTNIIFLDTVNDIFIGSDYSKNNAAYSAIDNLRISNISRPIVSPFGESLDVNYNSNLSTVFPVTEDLYTTLLLDFETSITKNTNFATISNKNTGGFDFTLNIFDSFDILHNSPTTKKAMETLINTLKSATSRAFIKYIG